MRIHPHRAPRRSATALGAVILVLAAACAHQPPPRAKFGYAVPSAEANASASRIAALAVRDARGDRGLDGAFENDVMQEVRHLVQAELLSTGLFSGVEWGSGLGMRAAESQTLWKIDLALTRTEVQIEHEGDRQTVVYASGVAGVMLAMALADAAKVETYCYVRLTAAVTEIGTGRQVSNRDYLGVRVAPMTVAQARTPAHIAPLVAEALRAAMAKFKSELGRVPAAS